MNGGAFRKSIFSKDDSRPLPHGTWLKFGEHFTHHGTIESNHSENEEVKKRFSWLNFQNWSWQWACSEKLCICGDLICSFHSLDWKNTGKLDIVLQFSFLFFRPFRLPLPFPISLQDIECHHHRKIELDCEETKLGFITQPKWNNDLLA